MTTIEQARQALEAIKRKVCGDRAPNWNSDIAVTQSRFAIADICDAALASLDGERGTVTHRHKKRGSEYTLIGIGKIQAEDWYDCAGSRNGSAFEPVDVDMREVAIYRGADGQLWVRPREEFEDGRFEALPALEGGGHAE